MFINQNGMCTNQSEGGIGKGSGLRSPLLCGMLTVPCNCWILGGRVVLGKGGRRLSQQPWNTSMEVFKYFNSNGLSSEY